MDRIRLMLIDHGKLEEKTMFMGMVFMLNDKMLVGVANEAMMVRYDPALHDEIAESPGFRPLFMKGRDAKGFGFIDHSQLTTDQALRHWISLALDYHPRARSSKKKKS